MALPAAPTPPTSPVAQPVGSALAGGWTTVVGSVLGALTIGLVNSLVFFMGTPSEWQNFVQGLAILLVLMAGVLAGRRARA